MTTATTTARNLWYDTNRGSMQPEFRYTGRPLFTYRDVQVFKSAAGGYDYVLAGATITQRAGFSREAAPAIIDALLTGSDPLASVAVREHIEKERMAARLFEMDVYTR